MAHAVNLDMAVAGWKPTVDTYLGRVPKLRILEAVHEAKGEQSAQLIDHLKKPEMAKEAERLLAGTGWLPQPLRLASAEVAIGARADEAETLPDFLASDEDEAAATDPEEPSLHAMAAEKARQRGGFGCPFRRFLRLMPKGNGSSIPSRDR